MEPLSSPLLLVAVALGLRLLPLRAPRAEPWRTPVEVALALGVGLVTAVVKAWWLAPHAMTDGTDTSDLPDICLTVEALRNLDIVNVQRQPMAALLPTALSNPLGLLDGVAAGALASAAGLGAALYLWGRVLHSRAAGVAAAVFSCAFSCYVVMPRYLTFYPECITAYALCAAAVAAALRWRSRACVGLAGAGVGLALSVDHTGLLYALVPLAVAVVVAVRPPPGVDDRAAGRARSALSRWRIPIRLGVLLAPVALSWVLARLITPVNMPALEDKAMVFTADNVGHQIFQPTPDVDGRHDEDTLTSLRRWAYPKEVTGQPDQRRLGYNWGRSGPLGVVRALATLALLTLEEPTAEVLAIRDRRWSLARMRAAQVTPWIPVALVSLLLVGLALRRRRWELAGLLVMLVPFAVLLRTVATTQVWPKYLMGPMLPVPVLLGVAWAYVAHRPAGEEKAGWRGRLQKLSPALAPLLAAVVIGLMVTGLVPTWLAPDVPRREQTPADAGFYRVYRRNPTYVSNTNLQSCFRLFEADQQRGIPARSRLYPRSWFQRRWKELRVDTSQDGPPPPVDAVPEPGPPARVPPPVKAPGPPVKAPGPPVKVR